MGTKDNVFNAALELFAMKGYSVATMDEIAAKVGIKKASLYNHYSSKESLLTEVYKRLIDIALPADTVPSPPLPRWESPEAALEAVVRAYIETWGNREVDLSWTIVSEEQYVDPRAAAIIVDVTDRYLALSAALFRSFREVWPGRFPGDSEGWAQSFAYGLRAMHLEYGLRKRHGLETSKIMDRMYAHAKRFARGEEGEA
jgi:AcrR family transcriptional regulator